MVEVGEEISEPDSVHNLPARPAVSADEDIAVTITDVTTPEQQQEPQGSESGGSTADSQGVETPPAAR